jgi:hypothetical protein
MGLQGNEHDLRLKIQVVFVWQRKRPTKNQAKAKNAQESQKNPTS